MLSYLIRAELPFSLGLTVRLGQAQRLALSRLPAPLSNTREQDSRGDESRTERLRAPGYGLAQLLRTDKSELQRIPLACVGCKNLAGGLIPRRWLYGNETVLPWPFVFGKAGIGVTAGDFYNLFL